jgi:hypothetical protein
MPAHPAQYPPVAPQAYPYPPADPGYGYPSVAPYAYPPVPPAPPRKRRVGLVIGLSLTAILVLAAAGAGTVLAVNRYAPVRAAGPSTSTSASASASPTASPTPAPYTGDLRKLLLPVPAGAKPYTVPILGIDGTITVDQASKDNYGDTSKVDFLKGIGFQRGAWVAWSQNGQQTYVEIYQFMYDSFTQEWADKHDRSATASYAAGVDVPDVPGGWCQSRTKPLQGGDYNVACHANRGYFYVQVDFFTQNAANPEAATQLLRQQVALLP